MKRIILATSLGLGILTFVIASPTDYHATATNSQSNVYDTVPKRDTTQPDPTAPAPDTTTIVSNFQQ